MGKVVIAKIFLKILRIKERTLTIKEYYNIKKSTTYFVVDLNCKIKIAPMSN